MKLPSIKVPNRQPSAPMIARVALSFARSPKRIKKFAEFINTKIDIPHLSEEQELELYSRTIAVALDAAAAAIEGKSVIALESLRDSTRDAVNFLMENIDELNDAIDIPFVPEALEQWAVEELKQALEERVLPWVDSTQRLQ